MSKSNFKTYVAFAKDGIKKLNVIIEIYNKWVDYKLYKRNNLDFLLNNSFFR